MPVYGSSTGTGGVAAHIGGRELTATSVPVNTADSDQWLDEAEAELLGAIRAGGGTASYAAATPGFLQVKKLVTLYVAGLVRCSHAAVHGDGENEDGRVLKEEWAALLDKFSTNSGNIIARLETTGVEPDAAVGLKSHTVARGESHKTVFKLHRSDGTNNLGRGQF